MWHFVLGMKIILLFSICNKLKEEFFQSIYFHNEKYVKNPLFNPYIILSLLNVTHSDIRKV